MTAPAISVVLPVYNAGEYLRQSLASLRWQTFADWEAVCVNDGSTDGSLAVLRDFAAADSRFRVIDQPNAGIVAALNRGLAESRADWVARMDADDVALPERFDKQLLAVRTDPTLVLVGSVVTTIDPEGAPLRTLPTPTEHEAIEQSLLDGGAPIAHPSVLMNKRAVASVGGYRPSHEWVEDADLWLRMARVGRLANLSEPLLRYRLHAGSVCWTRRAEQSIRHATMLAEARSERGLPQPAPRPAKQRKLSDPRGKWARQAARDGRLRVAAKWAGRLVAAEPWSTDTWRVTAEALLRGTVSVASGRRVFDKPLADWREWDCPPDPAAMPQAA